VHEVLLIHEREHERPRGIIEKNGRRGQQEQQTEGPVRRRHFLLMFACFCYFSVGLLLRRAKEESLRASTSNTRRHVAEMRHEQMIRGRAVVLLPGVPKKGEGATNKKRAGEGVLGSSF
jgi:hypothetical protein